jgi:hypothetical protein
MLDGIVWRIERLPMARPLAGRLNFLQEAPTKWLLWKKN